MSDQFFDDEEELARADAAASKAKRTARPAATPTRTAPSTEGSNGPKPPSFALVVAIAVVALLLGVCLGYFFAMSVVGTSQDAAQGSSAAVSSVATDDAATSATDATFTSMPADHPDISSMINADGTVNEEALAEYKAQRAAEQAASGGSGDSADSVESGSGN